MMQYIRQNAKVVFIVILLVVGAFIGTIFLVWGRGGKSSSELGVVAWVGETPIYHREQQNLYNNLVQFYRNIYKNLSTAELEKRFNLTKNALDSLIDRRAIIIEAQRRGIEVSDAEVSRKIVENQAFQSDGRFDSSRYQQLLRQAGQTPDQFEADQRMDLLVKKMQAIVKEGIKVTEAEMLEEFKRTKEKTAFEYVLVPPEPFTSRVTVGESEIAAHFEADKKSYFQPERIQLEYLKVEPNTAASGIQVSETAVSDYYNEHIGEFANPKMVHARHILFKIDRAASAEEDKKIKDRATVVLDKVKGGADFAALAKEFSQDAASGSKGGDLGWFPRDRMVKEFSESAFSLPKGGLSGLVRTDYGYHIIRVEDIREQSTKTLTEVYETISARIRNEGAKEAARVLADKLNEALYDQPVAKVAAQFGLEVRKTGYFGIEEPTPDLPLPKEVKEPLFGLNQDEVSEEIQWGGSRYFFHVVGRKAGHVPDLAEVREKVSADLLAKKAGELARREAEAAMKELAGGAAPDKIAGGRYVSGKVKPFALQDFVQELGTPGSTFSQAFKLEMGGLGGPVETPKGYVVFRITERTPVAMADFEKEKDQIKSRLWEQEADRFFQAWVDGIKKKIGVRMESESPSQL